MKKALLCFALLFLATSGPASGAGVRKLKYAEAAAFESSLIARGVEKFEPGEKIFTQPRNKTEPCKLPSTRDQLERKNFRAYWDGECKNGYAFGLGRDIAISDTHHVEEITVYAEDGETQPNKPFVLYDFVNRRVSHGVRGAKFPATSGMNQEIRNESGNFGITFSLGLVDESGKRFTLYTSPLDPRKVYLSGQGSVGYRLTDFTDFPGTSIQAQKGIEVVDLKAGTAGGVRIVQFRSGYIDHHVLGPGEVVLEHVVIPQKYVDHLLAKVGEIQAAINIANASFQQAQQLEREYLYMACNGKHSIAGLDAAVATEICTWRDQFKEPYEKALADYQQRMERQRQQSEIAEQQIQQQRMNQAQLAQQQAIANHQAWQGINNILQGTTNQINQINQQTQNLMSFPTPQVQPIAPPGGSRVTCTTLSNGTVICR